MLTSPVSDFEARRLFVLDSFGVLDRPLGAEFDDLLRLAQTIFDVPIVLLSLVTQDRQVFAARVGLDLGETAREGSFCTQTIRGSEVMVVLDALVDARFAGSPLVLGPPYIRFYAGAPLVSTEGAALGSFCIIDTAPRADFSAEKAEMLRLVGRLAMQQLEARREEGQLIKRRREFEAITALSPEAIITADCANRILSWNHAAEAIFGHTAQEAVGQPLSLIVPPALRPMHEAGLARVVAGLPSRIVGSLVTVPALHKDGTEFPIELSLTHWREGTEHRFGAIARDVTERVLQEERLKREACLDHLTGIPNRRALEAAMEEAVRERRSGALLLLDLDGFKDVNDGLGHPAGDEVLRVIARRLVQEVGEEGLVSRLGGDEFAVLLKGTVDETWASALARRLISAIERPIEVADRCIYIGASCGLAMSESKLWEQAALLADADLALYGAKTDSRSNVCLFAPHLRSLDQTRSSLSSRLRQAWERQEFEMHFQPQVRLDDGSLTGAEALIRWNHPERGLIGPQEFLRVLETSLLVDTLGLWILRTSCEVARRCRSLGRPQFRVAVNLFSAQFRSGDLPRNVRDVLAASGLPPQALELEITENTILEHDTRISTQLKTLAALGVGIAVDDYGTGYASLSMLKDHPVSRIKIDRSFVAGIRHSRQDRAVVQAIRRLAQGFDLKVIAEGVETEEQAELMRPYCSEAQGYLFGRPMAANDLEDVCRRGVLWQPAKLQRTTHVRLARQG